MNNKKEIIAGVVLIGLSVFLLNPFNFWMPAMTVYIVCAFVLATFVLYLGFILKEKPKDEREEAHLLVASRTGYLAGVTVLTGIFLYQAFTSHPAPEIVIALTVMVIGKLAGLAHGQRKM